MAGPDDSVHKTERNTAPCLLSDGWLPLSTIPAGFQGESF